jgi:hypothetical protein
MSLGIPGDAVMALLLGALIIQGIVPGPQLITQHPDLFWGLIASFWIGNILLVVLNVPMIGVWVKLLAIPYKYLYPSALFFVCIGVYSANNDLFQVAETLFIGLAGYVLLRLGFHPAPVLLGFVLGPRFEENFRRAMLIARGDLTTFVDLEKHWISAIFLALCVVLVVGQIIVRLRQPKDSALALADHAPEGAHDHEAAPPSPPQLAPQAAADPLTFSASWPAASPVPEPSPVASPTRPDRVPVEAADAVASPKPAPSPIAPAIEGTVPSVPLVRAQDGRAPANADADQRPSAGRATASTKDVFISYSSRDQEVAETICAELEGRNLRCWIAVRDVDPGDNFQEAIVRAIRAAKVMVLIFSKNANNSDEIKNELALASKNQLVVIPVRIEDVMPNDALSYALATRQWVDVFRDWKTAIDRLAARILSVVMIGRNAAAQ